MKMSHLVDVKSAFELGRRYAVGGGLCCLCLVSQIIFVSRVNDANLPDNARLLRCFNEQLRRLTAFRQHAVRKLVVNVKRCVQLQYIDS